MNFYGEEIHRATRTFEELRSRSARLICDLALLRHCREQRLIPTYTELSKPHFHLSSLIHPCPWNKIDKLAAYRTEKNTILRTKRNKCDSDKTGEHLSCLRIIRRWYNLSYRQLSKAAERVLTKGFNNVTAPNKPPVEKMVFGVENAINILSPNTPDTVHKGICTILRNTRPPKTNLNTEELRALLIELKWDSNIVTLLADKGNATVVLNTRDYED
ncbi:hypothetical protein Trydic_g11584 [Trypoxylus dichotomus]